MFIVSQLCTCFLCRFIIDTFGHRNCFHPYLLKTNKRMRAKPMLKLETTNSHAEDKFHKQFWPIYHLSHSESKINLNEPYTSANVDQVLMQGTLDSRMSSSMFEQQRSNSEIVNQSTTFTHHSQVRPSQTAHDQRDIEEAHADINAWLHDPSVQSFIHPWDWKSFHMFSFAVLCTLWRQLSLALHY